jgi:hypothetical protein
MQGSWGKGKGKVDEAKKCRELKGPHGAHGQECFCLFLIFNLDIPET